MFKAAFKEYALACITNLIATQCSKRHLKNMLLYVYILDYGKSLPNYYFAFTGL